MSECLSPTEILQRTRSQMQQAATAAVSTSAEAVVRNKVLEVHNLAVYVASALRAVTRDVMLGNYVQRPILGPKWVASGVSGWAMSTFDRVSDDSNSTKYNPTHYVGGKALLTDGKVAVFSGDTQHAWFDAVRKDTVIDLASGFIPEYRDSFYGGPVPSALLEAVPGIQPSKEVSAQFTRAEFLLTEIAAFAVHRGIS